MASTNTHENIARKHAIKVSSERSFGQVFAVVFAIIALLPLAGGDPPRWWSLAIAVALIVLAYAAPKVLAPANRLWFRFGLLLGRITNPLVMGLLFFAVFTPMGWLIRLFGKDLLNLRPDPHAKSYWIERESPAADSMRNQF